ncbi:hypothetical protein BGX26_002234 [Mortierella sp. AD094]|nr:hypothetical protein BGX26_002234 [Mortierella sp. AD094]
MAIVKLRYSPILRSLMLSSITPPTLHLSEPVPNERCLDPKWLLERTIENLCLRHLYSSSSLNADENSSEYAFQSEFTTILRRLVPLAYPQLHYKTLVEAKARDEDGHLRERLEILVRNGSALPAYDFGLVVAADKKKFDEHCERAEDYGRLYNCKMFVVNLCPKTTLHHYFGNRSCNLTPVNVAIYSDEQKGVLSYSEEVVPVSISGSEWDMLFSTSV